MYSNFIIQNSSSPYYHSIFQNGIGGELGEREIAQNATQASLSSFGLNFSNYVANYSLQNTKIENQNSFYNNQNIQSQINKHEDSISQTLQMQNDQINQQGQLKETLTNDQIDLASQNLSKSNKKRKYDQNIISAFARSTPQFYNINKKQLQQQQINSIQQSNNDMTNISNGNNFSTNNTHSPNIITDKQKISQISKIYSQDFQDSKRAQRKSQQLSQDIIEKKGSPSQLKKLNKIKNSSGSNFIEQQFYSTNLSEFPAKKSQMNIQKMDDKKIYIFQQQSINFFDKKKKTQSISLASNKNELENHNDIQQSQRLSNNDDSVQNQILKLANEQRNIIQVIKKDKKYGNDSLHNYEKKSNFQQNQNNNNNSHNSNEVHQYPPLSNQQQNSNISVNTLKKQSSSSSNNKNFLISNPNFLNTIQTFADNQQVFTNQQSHNQSSNIITSSSHLQKRERLSEIPQSIVKQTNYIYVKNQLNNDINSQSKLRSQQDKQKHYSLSKQQNNINSQENQKNKTISQQLTSSNRQYNKSNSTIFMQSSQNLKSSDDMVDQEDGALTEHVKQASFYYQWKQQPQQSQQSQILIRQNKTKRSQESPSIKSLHLKNQSEIIKRTSFAISQHQNNSSKPQGMLQMKNSLRRQSSLLQIQQNQQSMSDQFNEQNLANEPINKFDTASNASNFQTNILKSSPYKNVLQKIQQSEGNQIDKRDSDLLFIKNDKKQQNYKSDTKNENLKQISEDKIQESHQIINKKTSSQQLNNCNSSEQCGKKINFAFQNIDNKILFVNDHPNQNSDNKKQIINEDQNLENISSKIKKENVKQTVKDTQNEYNSQINERKKSHSPLKSFQSNYYPEGKYTDSTQYTHNTEEEIKNPSSKQNDSLKSSQTKNTSLHYQFSYKGDDYSPLGNQYGNKIKKNPEKKYGFSEKLSELRQIKQNSKSNQSNSSGQFQISFLNDKPKQNNRTLEQENVPNKLKISSQVNQKQIVENIEKQNEEPAYVSQQIQEVIAQISSNRPKTSEGGSRKRGTKLCSKIRFSNMNCFGENHQQDQIQNELSNQNSNNKQLEDIKHGQNLQRFYATHIPSMIKNTGPEKVSTNKYIKEQNQNDKNVYENIDLHFRTENKYKDKKYKEADNLSQLQNLLVNQEQDLGIDEFQIEEINDDNINEDYSQSKLQQQQQLKNNNYFSSFNPEQNHKILIRHNKSSNQTKRKISARHSGHEGQIQDEENFAQYTNKPKGTHLKSDFLSLFAQ